jgi:hypothetical protein
MAAFVTRSRTKYIVRERKELCEGGRLFVLLRLSGAAAGNLRQLTGFDPSPRAKPKEMAANCEMLSHVRWLTHTTRASFRSGAPPATSGRRLPACVSQCLRSRSRSCSTAIAASLVHGPSCTLGHLCPPEQHASRMTAERVLFARQVRRSRSVYTVSGACGGRWCTSHGSSTHVDCARRQ